MSMNSDEFRPLQSSLTFYFQRKRYDKAILFDCTVTVGGSDTAWCHTERDAAT